MRARVCDLEGDRSHTTLKCVGCVSFEGGAFYIFLAKQVLPDLDTFPLLFKKMRFVHLFCNAGPSNFGENILHSAAE